MEQGTLEAWSRLSYPDLVKHIVSRNVWDGGLYFPESVPRLEKGTLEAWSRLSYPDLVKHIVSRNV